MKNIVKSDVFWCVCPIVTAVALVVSCVPIWAVSVPALIVFSIGFVLSFLPCVLS